MQEKILSVRVHKAVNSIEYACSSVSGSHSVEVLDLQSSVAGMSKSQWSKLCRLLTKRPLLTLLSLRKCSITNDQGTCNILQSGGGSCCQRGKWGWTAPKSRHPCPCQDCSQGPPAERTGRGSLLNGPSYPPNDDPAGHWTELN